MSESAESPLITALPPHTDYVSYLTIVEQYLTKESLPILHKVLQDETLTSNIGWDLILILVPLLPESKPCLEDVARLGNPREVILKVTEALHMIDLQAQSENLEEEPAQSSTAEVSTNSSLWIEQFTTLTSLLSTLHSRIRTKYPSRFLSTTLRAVLASFSASRTHSDDAVVAIVQMVKTMARVVRPTLPSRSSSGMIKTQTAQANARDPEAPSPTEIDPEEKAMQARLYQSFITHVLEEYVLRLPTDDGTPGMAWSTRIMEKLRPERIIPHTTTVSSRFANDEKLHDQVDAIGQLISLTQDLKLSDAEILHTATTGEREVDMTYDEDDPPKSSDAIPLSQLGCVILYAARQASSVLHDRPSSSAQFAIFPQHSDLLNNAMTSYGTTVGAEPLPLVDAVLSLGLLALENDNIGMPKSDADFNEYLQITSLLASHCPDPSLRGHAHYLTSTILRSHPDEKVRYAFIRDTLEHCPFENLKTTAVGWLKGEIVEANLTPAQAETPTSNGATSTFASSMVLESLAPYLFPSLQAELVTADAQTAYVDYQNRASFFLAVLNFLYLLLSAEQLRAHLDVADVWKEHDIGASFLQPLRDFRERLLKDVDTKESYIVDSLDARGVEELKAELNVLAEIIERVTNAAKLLN